MPVYAAIFMLFRHGQCRAAGYASGFVGEFLTIIRHIQVSTWTAMFATSMLGHFLRLLRADAFIAASVSGALSMKVCSRLPILTDAKFPCLSLVIATLIFGVWPMPILRDNGCLGRKPCVGLSRCLVNPCRQCTAFGRYREPTLGVSHVGQCHTLTARTGPVYQTMGLLMVGALPPPMQRVIEYGAISL
ncbi:MAG: hypothetical protein CM15mP21_3080 [Hyphomicrobiales bacterium]|nr:MAG: hypothetical protein CM15mP21_3080 [Hyphomicrobiales bacterium]